jgi:adenylate cyclase
VAYREIHYRWEYDLESSPEKLWPFVADTNRFNRDTGVPEIEVKKETRRLPNARRRVQLSVMGMPVEWEEQPFEWVRPYRFGVKRSYSKGPVAELKTLAELVPTANGGTHFSYEVWITPKSFLGLIAIPLQVGLLNARRFAREFKRYDQLAATNKSIATSKKAPELSSIAQTRLVTQRAKLQADGVDPQAVENLVEFIKQADDSSIARMRPYALADEWKMSRRAVLEMCLRATRIGFLDLQWDLVCPLCRGAKESGGSLREISSQVHCDTCQIDFTVNFERYVEVTFHPNVTVRPVNLKEYCIGSPQRTPHVVVQQLLPAHSSRTLKLALEEGRYRLRTLERAGEQMVLVESQGRQTAVVTLSKNGWDGEELLLSPETLLQLENATDAEQLLILERLSWNDQAATAAEVTALQVFRDLFSTEALRPGEQISVGTLTVLFTDLRNSTRLYREIGDATAFGRVLNHFDVLKEMIVEEEGALVKTIGDAVMAVFLHPASALRAMLKAQQFFASPKDGGMPLILKAGIHAGPCIAVTLNDRLDYFGSTVNMAARLECLSSGNDVVVSRAVYDDPEVRMLMTSPSDDLQAAPFEMALKGFDDERFELWRIGPKKAVATISASEQRSA